MKEITNNENYDLCKKCGGACCKKIPCMFHPKQVILSIDGVKDLLKKGFCFDYWEGDIDGNTQYDRIYFMRTKTTSESIDSIVNASWGGACSLLGDNGCSLSWEDRPFGGKALIPINNNCMYGEGDKKIDIIREWRKY